MAYFKEIVTKAVIGKGKKITTESRVISPEETPSTVLGCWIINHRFSGSLVGKDIVVNGTYDINVWYSYDNDTKTGVCSSTYSYSDKMNVPINNPVNLTNNTEVIVNSLSDPNVTDVKIVNNEISMTIRKEMGIEVVGDTKMRVNVEDSFDDYTEIIDEDEINSDISDQIDREVEENFLQDEQKEEL